MLKFNFAVLFNLSCRVNQVQLAGNGGDSECVYLTNQNLMGSSSFPSPR